MRLVLRGLACVSVWMTDASLLPTAAAMTSPCLGFSANYPWSNTIAGFVVIIACIIENTLKGFMLKCALFGPQAPSPAPPRLDVYACVHNNWLLGIGGGAKLWRWHPVGGKGGG